MASLDLSNNYKSYNPNYTDSYKSEEFIRPIAAMLKTNRSIKEINLAGNNLNAEAGRIFSQDIQDNGALAFLTMHKYKLPIKEIKTATELDLSNKELNHLDAIVIAALVKVQTALFNKRDKTKRNSFQDNGALASLNLAKNNLGAAGAQQLAKVLPTW